MLDISQEGYPLIYPQTFDSLAGCRRKHDADRVAGPCDSCRQADRCAAQKICCEAFVLFARLGAQCSAQRWQLAPRLPSTAIRERLMSRRPTDCERRARQEALAVKMLRESAQH